MQPGRSGAAKLEAVLAEIERMPLEGLRARWHALHGTAAPPSFRVALLRSAIAYKLQERVLGGLKPSTRTLLHRVAAQAERGRTAARAGVPPPSASAAHDGKAGRRSPACSDGVPQVVSSTPALSRRPATRIKPGTRLLRTWQGTTHEVVVGQGEVTYQGRTYRSLSEVARIVTGQRWSGPLFFGLKGRAGENPAAVSKPSVTPGRRG